MAGHTAARAAAAGGLPPASSADAATDTAHGDWQAGAACVDADPDLFFPVSTTGPALRQVNEAKAICQACPVQQPCLAWALDQGVFSGIWGGVTEEERRVIRTATIARS